MSVQTAAVELERPIDQSASQATGWGAVFALTLCVATLIASEFMPVSLLTPIATRLGHVDDPARLAEALGPRAVRVVFSKD